MNSAGDQIDESLYLVDGYNAYFSFCQTKKGYSGSKLTDRSSFRSFFLPLIVGVVTFCRNSATPIAAEEGLTGILSSGGDIGGYGDLSAFTDDEVCSCTVQVSECGKKKKMSEVVLESME